MYIRDINQLARQFAALSKPIRLRILNELDRHAMYSEKLTHLDDFDPSTLPHVSALARDLKIPQSTLSIHLKVLTEAGLLKSWSMPYRNLTLYFIDKDCLEAATASIAPANV